MSPLTQQTAHRSFGAPAKIALSIAAAVLLPPFVLVVLVPVLFYLVPVAVVALPFVASALLGEVSEVGKTPRYHVRVLSPATVN